MADEAPDHSPEPTPGERRDPGPSDLVGVRLTLYLGIAIVATLASFFFVGVVVGIIVLWPASCSGLSASLQQSAARTSPTDRAAEVQ